MSNRYWLLLVPESLDPEKGWVWRDSAAEQNSAAEIGGFIAENADGVPGVLPGQGSLADFAALLAAERLPVLALLPVAQVLAVPVAVPQRQQRQMLSALPFLLEETLATDIERFHVIAGARVDAQRLQAVAIDRQWLSAALALMQAAGIDPDILTADALALPARGTVFLDGSNSLLLAPDGKALCFDARDASVVLPALSTNGDAFTLQVIPATLADESAARAVESFFLGDENNPVTVTVAADPCSLPDLLAAQPASAFARLPNLRQGAFAKTGSTDFSLGFDWRPLAWLAACWAVVVVGYQVAVGVSHGRSAAALEAAQVELYRQVFPGSVNVPKPRQQMEGQLKNASGQEGLFAALVAQTSAAFVELGGPAGGYSPRSLAWDTTQKQLRIDVQARSLEDLDKLRALLEQKGLVVDIGAGIAQDGGYKARMNVGAGA